MYRKLGRNNKIRRSILAGLTKDVIMHESIVTTESRAKEVRKFVDKMITYGKDGSLVARRKALAFLHNDNEVVQKVFNVVHAESANKKYYIIGRHTSSTNPMKVAKMGITVIRLH